MTTIEFYSLYRSELTVTSKYTAYEIEIFNNCDNT